MACGNLELNDMRNWDARRRSVLRMTRAMVWTTILGLSWSSSAVATEAQPAAVPPEFLTCYDIKRTGERLACYDRAVEYLKTGDAAAAPSAEGSFGLQARETRKNKQASSTSESEETESVTGRVTEISSRRDGMKIITLDSGQTWRQITGGTAVFLNVGDEVSVKRGALGSFLMHLPNGGPLRVRRIK